MSGHEMDDEIDDDIMDEAAEFELPEHFNIENDNAVPRKRRKQTKIDGGDGLVANKRAECWKHFHVITEKGDPKPRATCNFCPATYACHTKNNGTKSMSHHFANQCKKNPESKAFTGSRQKVLGFQKVKEGEGEGSANLVAMTFSVDACRRALAEMIIIDELPFAFVEGEGFKNFMRVVQPKWVKIPCRITVAKQCMAIYSEEQKSLKKKLKSQRLCLTTDTWTSVQNLNYMCLTGHFIDENWKYQKKILNFCVVPNHKGDTLGRIIESRLVGWGIDKFLTVTVDNASSNNLLIAYLKRKTKDRKTTILNHNFMHVRCSSHILNLIVRDGLQEIDVSIVRVRNVVRYVRSSPQRMEEFWECVKKEEISCTLRPCLDVPTRWNYTYFMLDRALNYQKAFDRLCDDGSFKLHVREEELDEEFNDVEYCDFEVDSGMIEEIERGRGGGRGKGKGKGNVGSPTSTDWEKIKLYVHFLKVFYIATLKFSGSLYVTCNGFFDEMVEIQQAITKLCATNDSVLHPLARGMSTKFDKYWGNFEKINPMMFYAVVLDPRCKVQFFEYILLNTLGYDKKFACEMTDKITSGITELFQWYVKNNASVNVHSREEVGGASNRVVLDGDDDFDNHKSLKSLFKMHQQNETNMAGKSELERYLMESSEDDNDRFDILKWWKDNSSKYPILSQVARDVLAIPVSTVASESAFSTSGRVIDPYRSSLAPNTVEALVCTQQWIKKPTKINLREQLDELEQLDSVLKEKEKEKEKEKKKEQLV